MARILSPGFDGLGDALAQGLAPHYLELGSDPHLVAQESRSCGALYLDRRNAASGAQRY